LNISILTIGAGQTLYAVIAVPEGAQTSTMFTRNVPPVVSINAGLLLVGNLSGGITTAALVTTDPDHEPAELTYTITTPPLLGTLSYPDTFTQADIDDGLVTYTFIGLPAADSFQFTVSDGVDITGIHTFTITP
jgi:hypothetical protein